LFTFTSARVPLSVLKIVRPKQSYGLPARRRHAPVAAPAGAEVLLETRLPYLDAAQRREVLRTTGLPAGNPILDGPEQWGRLGLFTAADGYGAFDTTVAVALDAAAGGLRRPARGATTSTAAAA
jgi:hypothetical protein